MQPKKQIKKEMEIAQAGNGSYSRASGMDIGLKTILNRINKIEKSTLETNRYTTYDDKFQIYLFIGIIFLILELSLTDKRTTFWNQFEPFKNEN